MAHWLATSRDWQVCGTCYEFADRSFGGSRVRSTRTSKNAPANASVRTNVASHASLHGVGRVGRPVRALSRV